jgi:hypothetical protein
LSRHSEAFFPWFSCMKAPLTPTFTRSLDATPLQSGAGQ